MKYQFRKGHIEAYFWILSLILLAFTNPEADSHYSLCLFKNLGFDFCPGCGLGHSIAFFFKGRFLESWQAHPIGFLAIVILIFRAYKILKPDIKLKTFNSTNYE
ncbi:DUF2752 domain-containing protein [Marinilabiliaceae bacterium A049]|nr:DUF2752 domain-containing protein [Marinilabiliaceae bacterium A049]